MSRKPDLPPIETWDGSLARAEAPDAADWQEVHSADGHSFWVPPEIAYIVREGEQWNLLAAILRPALEARRAAATEPRRRKRSLSMSPATLAMAAAISAYCARHPPAPRETRLGLAKKVFRHAQEANYRRQDLLDPESHVMRDIIEATLFNVEQDQKRRAGRSRKG